MGKHRAECMAFREAAYNYRIGEEQGFAPDVLDGLHAEMHAAHETLRLALITTQWGRSNNAGQTEKEYDDMSGPSTCRTASSSGSSRPAPPRNSTST